MRSHKERLELTDSLRSAMMKLAEGNPGAATALMTLVSSAEQIDPDSAFGAFGPLFALDTYGIYGSKIWVLWKDVCGCDAVKAETLFRAVQLGILSESTIASAAQASDVDFGTLNTEVRKVIPAFARLESTAA